MREPADEFLSMPRPETTADEKLASLRTIDQLIAEREGNADIDKARAFLRRNGGEPPTGDDLLPPTSPGQ